MIIHWVFLKRFWREFWKWSFSSTKTILKTKKKVLPSISIIIARKSTIDNLIMVVTLSWSMFLWDEFKPELIRNSEFTERRTVGYRVMKISHCHTTYVVLYHMALLLEAVWHPQFKLFFQYYSEFVLVWLLRFFPIELK